MTLPQSPATFKAMLLPIGLLCALWVQPALAQATDDPSDPHQTLFTCGTDGTDDMGFLSLSGIERDFAVWTDLRFDRTANGDGHQLYRFDPGAASKTAFLFSHSEGHEGYLVSIRWVDQGATYVYYSLDIPPDPNLSDDAGGGDAALVISRDGKLVEHVSCTERPYMFIEYMRRAMSCDTANPYGPAACEDHAPERQVPLDVKTIGLEN